jgi:hypothetical protein
VFCSLELTRSSFPYRSTRSTRMVDAKQSE